MFGCLVVSRKVRKEYQFSFLSVLVFANYILPNEHYWLMSNQTTPLIAGLAVAAAAYAGRYGIQAWQAFKARPPTARMRKFYEGGFQSVMTRREAALILGVRYCFHHSVEYVVLFSSLVIVVLIRPLVKISLFCEFLCYDIIHGSRF